MADPNLKLNMQHNKIRVCASVYIMEDKTKSYLKITNAENIKVRLDALQSLASKTFGQSKKPQP